jgi:predicted TIM-barrel fold metal-dependent hydrolase
MKPHRLPMLAFAAALSASAVQAAQGPQAADLPIFDAHVHYSHDAWDVVPVADVIALMRKAGLKRALVSSSNDDGTQKLYAAAPELVVPSLRPYRTRGEISTWVRDSTVAAHVEDRLERFRYAAIGEFHLYGADADLPVPRRLVELAGQYRLILHAHSDADAIERIFRQSPDALVLWAHSGFDSPASVTAMLRKHRNLYADLAYRSDMGGAGRVDPDWLAAFLEFPDRFMVGTDTFTPERLHYIPEHADFSRGWLAALAPDLAERIAWKNAESLIAPVWAASRARHPSAAAEKREAAPGDACNALAGAAPGAQRLESDRVVVVYRVKAGPIRIGQPFSLDVAACPKGAAVGVRALGVDAQMPEHRHGMNYAPKIASAGDGRFSADGLVLHMAGHWQLTFDVQLDGARERLLSDLRLQ